MKLKLKLKILNIIAGRPVSFIHPANARKLNIHAGERIEISKGGKKIISITDVASKIVKENEIGFSKELLRLFALSNHDEVEVNIALSSESINIISKKLHGKELSRKEIINIIKDIVTNSLTEAEIAYFVSAVYEKGMTLKETIYLTEAIYKTGKSIKWHTNKIADKHSIGGIAGNRTTPIVVSICASAGIVMPKTSSRAITSASGTADAVETVSKVDFNIEDLKKIVKKTNACLAWGGSLGLAPADDKLIRIERLLNVDPESQLIASILGKKLSAGSKYVLIDIPYGNNAKVTKKEAKRLKQKFIKIGKHFGLKIEVVLTPGNEPIGNGIGPVLEMRDVLRVLKRENPPIDLENKSIFLASKILEMMKKAKKGNGTELAKSILNSGKAYKKFLEIINAQGRHSFSLKNPKFKFNIYSSKSGKITEINNHKINSLAKLLGCPTDKNAGIYLYYHVHDKVKRGDLVLTLYAESDIKLKEAIFIIKRDSPIQID